MPLLWDLSTLADHLARHLAATEADLRLEQAVYGIDSRPEVDLHSTLAAALAPHFLVHRESHYPSDDGPRKSHRNRCDIVLTPLHRPLQQAMDPPDLFAPPDPCPPENALWIEVKIAAQFRAPGVRHSGYGAQWQQAVIADLKKMEADPRICEAALLLLAFTEDAAIIAKDLDLFESVLVRKETLAGFRHVRAIPIQDRIGHSVATVALWPTIQRQQPT